MAVAGFVAALMNDGAPDGLRIGVAGGVVAVYLIAQSFVDRRELQLATDELLRALKLARERLGDEGGTDVQRP